MEYKRKLSVITISDDDDEEMHIPKRLNIDVAEGNSYDNVICTDNSERSNDMEVVEEHNLVVIDLTCDEENEDELEEEYQGNSYDNVICTDNSERSNDMEVVEENNSVVIDLTGDIESEDEYEEEYQEVFLLEELSEEDNEEEVEEDDTSSTITISSTENELEE
ncbi:proline-, glutamic acid- and leucine-rich protein 1-like [Aphis gossypii]|uniref:proline-, glutamic acid- and leucine-rich protein 1-like n=1 Tax=Aphis gossypii TaxID=80765 RepID=UPI002158F8A9|nr:proline-, glutamic acid- and leucine-rich protein 1-like [Aphis gossypii]XP_050062513.1 proline-, glutamic acid- and leucine-rich protein 1-like [Aphis gossypii]